MPGLSKGARETILIVDDDKGVLGLVTEILQRASFNVLAANSPDEAITLARQTDGKIHLLLADVQMPRISGPKLGDLLTAMRPDMRIVLMSGWLGDCLPDLEQGWHFIQKPFSPSRLIQTINETLAMPVRPVSAKPDQRCCTGGA